VENGRLLGGQITSRVKRLIGRHPLCAKAKRQLQSAQPERKSTPRFAEEPY